MAPSLPQTPLPLPALVYLLHLQHSSLSSMMGGKLYLSITFVPVLRIASAQKAINFSQISRGRRINLQWRNVKWRYTFVTSPNVFPRDNVFWWYIVFCNQSTTLGLIFKGRANVKVKSCLLRILQYQPTSSHNSRLSIEQPISFCFIYALYCHDKLEWLVLSDRATLL